MIGVGAYAFTASNTIPEQTAGGGAGKVTGYVETGVSYTWSVDHKYITATEFELEGALKPSDVAVALSNVESPAKGEWTDCSEISGAGPKYLVKCKFLGSEGAHLTVAELGKDYKWTATGVPNAEGNSLSVSAVSEGVAIVEGS
ncbi:MAG: hypothetical protein ACHQE6_05620 [Solirubrobacterales bacterium]